MRLSIFPKVKHLPSSKEEKQRESRKTGPIRNKETGEIIHYNTPETIEIETEDDLIRAITSYVWSPSVYHKYRAEESFKSCDFAVLDFDDGITIEEVEKRISEAGFTALCMPSTSHTPEHHKFRVIFPLSKTITSVAEYRATILDLMEAFPESDPKCKDAARFFFGSREDDGFWLEGDLLEPVVPPKTHKNTSNRTANVHSKVKTKDEIKDLIKDLYGEDRETIPEAVAHFIENAHTGLEGTWVCDLNNFVFVLALQGIPYDDIVDLVAYLSPMPQSPREMETIKRAYEDGREAAEMNEEPDLVSYEGE